MLKKGVCSFYRLLAALIFALASFSVGISAASRSIVLKASPSDEQTTRYDQGTQMLISRKSTSGAAITFLAESYNPSNPIDFVVAVKNDFKHSINFSTDSISAQCDNNKAVHIFYPEEALRDQEKRTFNASDRAGLSPADIQTLAPQMEKYYQQKNEELRNFARSLLRVQTIMSAGTYEGMVRMVLPKCQGKLDLRITVGDDTHSFVFGIKER